MESSPLDCQEIRHLLQILTCHSKEHLIVWTPFLLVCVGALDLRDPCENPQTSEMVTTANIITSTLSMIRAEQGYGRVNWRDT